MELAKIFLKKTDESGIMVRELRSSIADADAHHNT